MSIKLSICFTIFLVLSVFLLNYFFLHDFLGWGLTHEDWPFLVEYKYNPKTVDNNFLVRAYKSWVHYGPNWTHQILYIGLLDQLFPYNWEFFLKLNFLWKILATLTVFPAIWVLTKKKLLATLATLSYAISPAANGSLTIVVTGTEYIGVIFLNLFIIAYYYLIKNNGNLKFLILSFFLLYLSIFSASMRIVPVLVLLAITEIILVIKGFSKIKTSIVRLVVYLVPFYIMFRLVDPGLLGHASIYNNLVKDLLAGNWQLMVNPLAGLGYTLISPDSVRFFGFYGMVKLSNLGSYFDFLLGRGIIPLILILTVILASVISQKPKRFIIITLLLQAFFIILIYIFATHYLYIPKQLALPYNGILDFDALPAIFGSYFLAIAMVTGFEWYKTGMKDKLLLIIFLSPFLALSLISATWFVIGKHFAYDGTVQRYLVIPQLGVSLLTSSILVMILKKIKSKNLTALFYLIFFVIFLIYFFIFSYRENQYFIIHRLLGTDMVAQKYILELVFNSFDHKRENFIVYNEYDLSTISVADRYWWTALNYGVIPFWLYLRKYYITPDHRVNGCIGWAESYSKLKMIFNYSNGQATFSPIDALCATDSIGNQRSHTFNEDDFFAFRLKGNQVFDITKETLDKLKKGRSNFY